MPQAFNPQEILKYKPTAVPPLFSILFLLGLCWSFYCLSNNSITWVKHSSFAADQFFLQLHDHSYLPMLQMMFSATFAQINIWHFVGNAYFIWFFGSVVEQRLGNFRYLFLLLVSIFGGWFILGQFIGMADKHLWISPALLNCGLLGAYICFYPKKPTTIPMAPGQVIRTSKNILPRNASIGFGIPPWLIMLAFIVYEVVMHFILNQATANFDNLNIIAAACNFAIGLAITNVLIYISRETSTNPLKQLAISQYKQLRVLDMNHAQAIAGVANLLSVPPEQVSQWVAERTASLPDG